MSKIQASIETIRLLQRLFRGWSAWDQNGSYYLQTLLPELKVSPDHWESPDKEILRQLRAVATPDEWQYLEEIAQDLVNQQKSIQRIERDLDRFLCHGHFSEAEAYVAAIDSAAVRNLYERKRCLATRRKQRLAVIALDDHDLERSRSEQFVQLQRTARQKAPAWTGQTTHFKSEQTHKPKRGALDRISAETQIQTPSSEVCRQQELDAQSRSASIERMCQSHGIRTLIHFTRVENLASILQHGLLGRYALLALPMERPPAFNDEFRYDGHREAVCLSISFPNYQMFYKYRTHHDTDWCVICLDVAILWELDCAFCRENAASNTVTAMPVEERKRPSALDDVFSDCVHIRREDLSLPRDLPTHPQAEILVFESIPPAYIREIHFPDKSAWKRWVDGNPDLAQNKLCISKQYFRPRQGFGAWAKDEGVSTDRQSTSLTNPTERS